MKHCALTVCTGHVAVGCDRPTMRDLVKHVVPLVGGHWYDLGLELLNPKYENELDTIESETTDRISERCRKMFSIWLRTDPQASWNKVVTCLTQASLENVAHNVEKLLLQGE